MVLDILINPVDAEKRPWQMFFLGLLFSSLAIILSLVVFMRQSSLVMVFLTVLASFPIIYNTIKLEELKDEQDISEPMLLKEHGKALEVFMFLFLGILVSCTVWFVFLPADYISTLFGTQISTFQSLSSTAIGHVVKDRALSTIFLNNLRVLSICVLFSSSVAKGIMMWL